MTTSPTAPWGIHQFRERARTNREKREQRRARLIELLEERGELYCVDAAVLLGLGHRGFATAKTLLTALERDGFLVSETRRTGKPGPGRKYFRLAVKPPA